MRRWTTQEKQQLETLHRRGVSYAEIGRRLQRSEAAVRQYYRSYARRPLRTLTQRRCLCCATPFASEGAHHRLCNDCRQRESGPETVRICVNHARSKYDTA